MENELREKLKLQIEEINTALFGMSDIVKIYVLSKIADLTVLFLGEHAIAKSSLARAWSTTTGLDFRIVTSSEVDESLIAYIDPAVFRAKNIVEMRPGELMLRDHILIDEFFLWNNKYRAKLHQLLEEKTYAGCKVQTKTYTFASNPLTEHYAGQIEDRNLATEDRIDLLISMYQPRVIPTQHMIKKFGVYGRKEKPLQQKVTWEDYLKARDEIMKINVPKDVLVWLTLFTESLTGCKYATSKFDISRAKMKSFCGECNENKSLCAKVALSKPRFLRATILLAKALAWFENRDFIERDDLYTAVKYTLPHRIIFLQEEKTIFEAEKEVPEILQTFNDNMTKWETRSIFKKLDDLILAGKDPISPKFLQQEANDLSSEVAEDLPIKNYVTEAMEAIQKSVKESYLKILGQKNLTNKEDIKKELDTSGLTPYDKAEIIDKLLEQNSQLTFFWPIDRKNDQEIEKLAKALETLHSVESQLKMKTLPLLIRQFKREIRFSSDLLNISEERNRVKIVCSSPSIKNKLEALLKAP